MERNTFTIKLDCLIYCLFFGLAVLYFSGCSGSGSENQHTTWQVYGGSPDQSKYFIQDQITKENVQQLEVVWEYKTMDETSYQNNPIVVDSIMFVMSKDNSLVALDARNGEEIWIHANLNGITRRGVNYWESKDGTDKRIVFTLNNTLQVINAETGQSILDFGNNGTVDLKEGLGRDKSEILRASSTTPGRIFEDLIIVGSSTGESYLSSPGHIRAFSVISGEMKWIFHTIPQPGEYGYDTWPEEAYRYAGGVNCWGEISIDEDRGIAYIPLGSPTYDYYGADRLGANLFGNCLVALDARTGERIWHFQTIHHDLWDYDLVSAPQLLTVSHEGKKVDVVAQATKQGFLFVFDRTTGKPLWPIEERAVPPSDMPGEEAWPTQPFPTVLPPFTRQIVEIEDISPIFLSEQEFEQWKERVSKARKGLYTPLSTTETIAMPGAVGGANWGNTASNPGEGYFYVMSQAYPSFYKLEERPPALPPAFQARIDRQEAINRGTIAYEKHCQPCHGKDMAGTVLGPSLLGIAERLNAAYLRQTIVYGISRMPPVQHIGDEEISDILALLEDKATVSTSNEGEEENLPEGPVVASGGAPIAEDAEGPSFNLRGREYPEGIDVPVQRFYTGYGLGYPYILNPPWTSITAYDLNDGSIKWTRPLGEDSQAVAAGYRNTGVPTGSQRNGMIITSNGLVFATVTDGKIYAYDAETGEILWTGQVSMGIACIPSMYEIDGRVYIVVNATTPLATGWNLDEEEEDRRIKQISTDGAYYVFALPEM